MSMERGPVAGSGPPESLQPELPTLLPLSSAEKSSEPIQPSVYFKNVNSESVDSESVVPELGSSEHTSRRAR